MSKSSKSTKYTHPKGQLPTMQYACTGGTTTVLDVIIAMVIKLTVNYQLELNLILNL
jgi:hypothetical protein